MSVHTTYHKHEVQSAIPTVFGWLRKMLAARRARREEIRAVEYLRTLDPHLLEDIGVDIASLNEFSPRLESLSPHVVAYSAIQRAMIPDDMNSR